MILRFQTDRMRKVSLCEGDFDRYVPEGAYKDAAVTDILSLNVFIEQLRDIVGLPFPLIRSSSIQWDIPKDNTGMFTWVKNETPTPTGKPPKYAQRLHFVARYFGEIYYLKGEPGKARIIAWPDINTCVVCHCKMVGNELSLWKVENKNLEAGEIKIWKA